MANLVETLQGLELNDLVAAAQDANLATVIVNNELTVFAPVDGSFDGIEEEASANNEVPVPLF